MRKALPLAVLSVSLLAEAAAAQQKPNFSGTWIIVTPVEHAGQEQTIRHGTSKIALIHEASHGDDHTMEYPLDGTEGRHVMKSFGQDIVSVSAASWNGEQLVIMRDTQYPDGRKIQTKMTFAFNAEGLLVVEMTDTVNGQAQPKSTVVSRKKE